MAHCNQCGWDWDARVPAPAACTRCKRYDWQEPKKGDGDAKTKARSPARVPKAPAKGAAPAPESGGGASVGGTVLPKHPIATENKAGIGNVLPAVCLECHCLNGLHAKGCKR